MAQLPPRQRWELGQMALIASVIQSSKVFASVAQKLTEAPFWRQHAMGKGDPLGTNSSFATCQLYD